MTALRIAATLGFLAVVFGAFGAHGLKGKIPDARLDNWNTATLYHLVHAVVLLAIALRPSTSGSEPARPSLPFWLFTAGIVIFSGSLYLLAVTDATKLGAVTPFGGLCLLAGWAALAIRGR